MTESFYTPERLAERLSVSETTVHSLIKRGEIASYKIGRCRRIAPEDVEAYLERRKT